MNILSLPKIEDLRDLQKICDARRVEVVLIGAMAYRLFIEDAARETRDVDLALALDLEDIAAFRELLGEQGWRRDERREERWRTRRGSWVDLLPAGPRLGQKKLIWPESGRVMSLVGFDQVFRDAVA